MMELGSKRRILLAILRILSHEELHGYGITEKLEEIYGIKKPSSGVIYPILSILRNKGFIDIVREEERDKKIYRITDRGTKFLEENREEVRKVEKTLRNLGRFYRMGGKELYETVHELVKNIDSIDEKNLKEAEKVIKETALRIKLLMLQGEMNE